MSKHTPGPWEFYWRTTEDRQEADCGVFYQERPGLAYSICRAPRYVKLEEWEANARLIAAAPALLEALQLMRKHFSNVAMASQWTDDQAWADLCAIAAINEATKE